MSTPHRRAGATLVELVGTLGVAAILSTLAIPTFAKLHRSTVRTTTINDFVHSIHLARSEAIKRNSVVSICRSIDGTRCSNTSANWSSGWIVFQNDDRDSPADTDSGEAILYRRGALKTGTLVSNRVSFSFRPFNQSDVNGTVHYCPEPAATDARAIIISHTGRPRTSGKDAAGKPLKC